MKMRSWSARYGPEKPRLSEVASLPGGKGPRWRRKGRSSDSDSCLKSRSPREVSIPTRNLGSGTAASRRPHLGPEGRRPASQEVSGTNVYLVLGVGRGLHQARLLGTGSREAGARPRHASPGLTSAEGPVWGPRPPLPGLNCCPTASLEPQMCRTQKAGGARSRPGFRAGFAEVRSSVHDPLGSGASRASANGRGGRGGDWPGDVRGPRVASPPSRSLGPAAPPARRPPPRPLVARRPPAALLKPAQPCASPKPTGPEPAPPVCGPVASAPPLRSRRWVQSPARRCGPGLSFAGVVGKRRQRSLAQFVLGGCFALLELLLLKRFSTPSRRSLG